ncbi:MAG: glycosyltransferase family 39 protein [Candidatus Levybacteria bacterium]|nr:glycosyltransferase family 39 protein [Candidatus Levybacteria bacterium]
MAQLRFMRLFNRKIIALTLIILSAVFLRFYQLSTNPPSLTWDEAAWGYNAYSLGIDGKDEFGKFLPIQYLESFGDFKPPVYAYLDIIPIKIFGLNEFAIRFPSALFGVLTVLATYFLVKRIFYKSKNSENYALLSSLFLAISPWHILLSRAAFEANVASFFIVLGIWGFLAAVEDKRRYLVISAVSFALSMYTFNTARIVVPLLVIILAVIFRKQLFVIKKEAIIAVVIGFLIFAPLIGFLLSPQAGLRFKEVNIFTDPEVVKTANQEIANDQNALWSKVIHNRRVLYSLEFVKHYFDNLSPLFLFIRGDGNPKFSTQEVGQMYLFDIVFFVSGIFLLLKRKEGYFWLIPLWLLIGIIPAATARETPHALRIETTLPTFQIITAYGFIELLEFVRKRKKEVTIFLLSLLFLNCIYFTRNYFTHYRFDFSGEWQYGYKESISFVKNVEDDYDYVQVTQTLGRPYIYYLLYQNISPEYFRENSVIQRDPFGFVTVERVGKYLFPKVYSYELSKTKKVLYINTPYNLPKNIHVLKTFYLLDGKPELVAYTYD